MPVTGLIDLPPAQLADSVVINQNFARVKTAVDALEGAGLNQQSPSVTSNVGNAYAVTHPYPPTALYNNFVVYITPTAENTGPATLQVASLPIKSITKWDNRPLDAGDLKVGITYQAIYDGTQFQLQAAPMRNFVQAIFYGLKCDGVTDDAPALQRAVDAVQGGDVLLPEGEIVIASEVVCLRPTTFVGVGNSGLYGELFSSFVPTKPSRGTRLVIKAGGAGFPRYLRSKSVYRGSASDPNDPPYNSVFNFQGVGSGFNNLTIWQDMDVTNLEPTYEGETDIDCIAWVSRPKFTLRDTHILGHVKVKSILVDLTRCNPNREGTVQAVGTGQVTLESGSGYSDEYNGCFFQIIRGPGAGEAPKLITGFNAATQVLSYQGSFTVTPTTASMYRIFGREFSTPGNHPNKPGVTYLSTPERGADGLAVHHGCLLWGCRAGIKTVGAEPKAGLDWYGTRFTLGASATFSANPADGDTLTLAEVTFTFKALPTASTDIEIQPTLAQTLAVLEDACVELATGTTAPRNFARAVYYVTATTLNLYSRFDDDAMTGYTLAESSAAITLSGSVFDTVADSAPYWDPVTNVPGRDQRGSFGFSDFWFDGEIVQTHPSRRRRGDPNYPLAADTIASDAMQFAIDLSGMAGNASRTIHRHFVGNNARIMVMEGCIRVNRASRLLVDKAHFEWSYADFTSVGVPIERDLGGTAQGGGPSTITLAATPHFRVPLTAHNTNNAYRPATIRITSGPGAGESKRIIAYNGTTKVATVDTPWTVQPTSASVYVLRMVREDITYRWLACHQGRQYVAPRISAVDQVPRYEFIPTGSSGYANTNAFNGRNVIGGFLDVYRTLRTGRDVAGTEGNRMVLFGGKDTGYASYNFGTRLTEFAGYMRYTPSTRLWQLNIGGSDTQGSYPAIQASEVGTTTQIQLDGRDISSTVELLLDGASNIIRNAAGDLDQRCPTGAMHRRRVGSTTIVTESSTTATYVLSDLRINSGTARWISGTGSPEGVVSAPVGSIFSRSDGGAATSLYVKESGTGNTGWVGK